MKKRQSHTIYCQTNFQQAFQSFKQKFNKMNDNQQYYVSIQLCQSKVQADQIFDLLLKHQKPNMIQLMLRDVNLSLKQLIRLTTLKWSKMQSLQICSCKIDDEYYKTQQKCEIFSLQEFYLQNCQINFIAFQYIFQFHLPNITKLYIGSIHLSKNVIKHFVKSKWSKLAYVWFCNFVFNIGDCGLQEETMKFIIKCEWKDLQFLCLVQNSLIDSCFNIISESNWNMLKKMDLGTKNVIFLDNVSEMSEFGVLILLKQSLETIRLNLNLCLKKTIPKIINKLIKFK